MPKFTYAVTVEADTQAEADQVVAERISYDEPYFEVDGVPKPEGITYTISAHGGKEQGDKMPEAIRPVDAGQVAEAIVEAAGDGEDALDDWSAWDLTRLASDFAYRLFTGVPEGVEVIIYSFNEGLDEVAILALRGPIGAVQVASLSIELCDLVPEDGTGTERLTVLLDRLACELSGMLPAYLGAFPQ